MQSGGELVVGAILQKRNHKQLIFFPIKQGLKAALWGKC